MSETEQTTKTTSVWQYGLEHSGSKVHEVLASQVADLRSIEDSIRETARQIQRDLDGALRNLDSGYHLNSLGELQSRGPRFDALCAERERTIETIKRLCYATGEDAAYILTLTA